MGRGRLLIVSSVPRPTLIPRRAIAVVRAFWLRLIRVACFSPFTCFSPLTFGPTHGGEGPIPCSPTCSRETIGTSLPAYY